MQAQGTFRNLDFESANLPPIQFGGPVSSLDAIPGWKAFLGTTQVTQVWQNDLTLGNASIDILGPYYGGRIEGQYTVVLQPGFDPFVDPFGISENVSASISQSALMPANARSLQFKAIIIFGSISVNMGGQDLFLMPLGTDGHYTLYGADISLFAGQFETLTITALAGPNNPFGFDSFVFSPLAVPEPSTLSLLALGGLLFGLRRRLGLSNG